MSFFKGKWLATIQDLNFLYEKQGTKQRKYLKRYKRHLGRITELVCISKYVENDVRRTSAYVHPIEIVYNGIASTEHIVPLRTARMEAITGPFLLSVGTFMRKKNLHVLLPLLAKLSDIQLVFAGKIARKEYFEETMATVRKLGLEGRVVCLENVTEEEKKYLYIHCMAFVFPSFAEGFGVPPIEAMSYGKPVFVSDLTSIPEICGEMAFYWTDFVPENMLSVFQKGMETYQKNPLFPEKLKQYATRYSWRRTTRQYIRLYEECLHMSLSKV
jgi:glycosyltransferase involved in cell wall biosynthesis